MKSSTVIRATILLLSVAVIYRVEAQSKKKTGWSKWVTSKCSVTCGNGVIRRTRKCLGGKCKGKAISLKQCRAGSCQRWSKWSDFRPCDVTCGKGKKTRTRKCIGGTKCKGKRTQTATCTLKACPEPVDESGFTFWTKYGQCSDACGGGVQSRTRRCPEGNCSGHRRQIRNCRMKPCPGGEQTSWGKYGPCSVTCEAGLKSRFKGSIEQKITCVMPECTFPVDGYSAWSNYGTCSVRCGGGVQERTRSCLIAQCSKHDTEIRNCRTKICQAVKCKNQRGNQYCRQMKSRCKSAAIANQCNLMCKKCPVIASWTEYGPCSAKCGAGLQSRTLGRNKQSITCFGNECDSPAETPCTTGELVVDPKNACSSTYLHCEHGKYIARPCGPGTKFNPKAGVCDFERNIVACRSGSTTAISTTPAATTATEVNKEWNEWLDWSPCTQTCGGRMQTRSRTCTIPAECHTLAGDSTQTVMCNANPCPAWQDWSEWGSCTPSGNSGTRTRTRTCTVTNGCQGYPTESESCNVPPFWQHWSDWSTCTETCGGGTITRYRSCSISGQCQGELSQTTNCNVEECPKTACTTGALVADPNSACSSTYLQCEHGVYKSRQCGPSTKFNPTAGYCDWERNIAACGSSSTTPVITTTTPAAVTTISDVNIGNLVGSWSLCSKTCGEGTRNRQNCTGGTCIQEFEGCDNGKCPEVNCAFTGLLRSNRYGSSHECCSKTIPGPDSGCGRVVQTLKTLKRIIGGKAATKGRWPWMAAVQSPSGFCAGSIITNNFVLSAAHCFALDSGQPLDTKDFRIIPGILLLSDSSSATKYEIASTYIHPDYTFPKADIALVKLVGNIAFGDIQPICLPRGERPPIDSTCYVTGWGVSTVPNTVTSHLQELNILNLDRRVCINGYGKMEGLKSHVPFLKSNQGYLCAGSLTRPVDSCSGDSGGPLVCQRCDSCTWYIAGVVSLGPNPCATIGAPGVYSDVQYYEDWILKTTGLPTQSLSCPQN